MLSVKAQYSVQSACEKIRFINLPYEAGKNNLRIQSVGITNPNNVMPDKLYKDFQCTDYVLASSDPELNPILFGKFQVPIQFGLIATKQFRITSDGKVTIAKLVPTSSTSVKFYDLDKISAYKVDETYSINSSGIFVKEREKKYETKNYSKSQLDTMSNDLWDL